METYTSEQLELIKELGLSVNGNGLVDFDEDGGITYTITLPTKQSKAILGWLRTNEV